MTIACATLRLEKKWSVPQTSYGPFRLALPLLWLILATRLHVVAYHNEWVRLLALIIESFAVLQAFLAMAQRSIGGLTNLDGLTLDERFGLSLGIFWRIALLMIAAWLATTISGYPGVGSYLRRGLIGAAFSQVFVIEKFWSAAIAALVLLMIVDAKRGSGKVAFSAAVSGFVRRSLWLGPAVIALGLAYVVLRGAQGLVHGVVVQFYQTSSASLFIRNLIYFMYVLSFATLQLWVTLSILTFGLKQSHVDRK